MPKYRWPGDDDRSVIAEMLADLHSPHWEECDNYVTRYLQHFTKIKFPSFPESLKLEAKQDTMESIHRGLAKFRFESKLTTWAVTIARNKVIDIQRKLHLASQWEATPKGDPNDLDYEDDVSKDISRLEASTSSLLEDALLIEEMLNDVERALEEYIKQHKHQARNKRILFLVMIEEHSCEETARILGLNAPVVRHVVREARKFLKEKFPDRPWHQTRFSPDPDE